MKEDSDNPITWTLLTTVLMLPRYLSHFSKHVRFKLNVRAVQTSENLQWILVQSTKDATLHVSGEVNLFAIAVIFGYDDSYLQMYIIHLHVRITVTEVKAITYL